MVRHIFHPSTGRFPAPGAAASFQSPTYLSVAPPSNPPDGGTAGPEPWNQARSPDTHDELSYSGNGIDMTFPKPGLGAGRAKDKNNVNKLAEVPQGLLDGA